MALPTKRTLVDLRGELSARLGFAASGPAAGPNVLTLNSFLRTAQAFLYWNFGWKILRKTTDITTGDGQIFYDYPDDCDPDQISTVVAVDTLASSPHIWPLTEGIDWYDDNYSTPKDEPKKYDRRAQIEIWPTPPSNQYYIRLEYIKRLGNFVLDTDKATIDEDMILILAIADAKAHYKQEDAAVYVDRAKRFLAVLTAKGIGKQKFPRAPNKGGTSRLKALDEFEDLTRHVNTLDT